MGWNRIGWLGWGEQYGEEEQLDKSRGGSRRKDGRDGGSEGVRERGRASDGAVLLLFLPSAHDKFFP